MSASRWRDHDILPVGAMIRRKLVAAVLFFTLFGVIALMPPFIFLFRFDARILGIPVETVYVFVLWALLIAGACWFSRVLPDETPRSNQHPDPRA